MNKIRVLVVDDSILVRRILCELLMSDPQVEIVGEAGTVASGIELIGELSPDVVLLDVMMPDVDGIEGVRRIRETWPDLPVIMCSSLTGRGAEVTLRAITSGATDYVTKPNGPMTDVAGFAEQLLLKVKTLALAHIARRSGAGLKVKRPARPDVENVKALPRTNMKRRRADVSALAIGSSTGGPNALARIFAKLPNDLPVPVLIVQHMPPLFTQMLSDRLSASTGFAVREAVDGEIVRPGRAYVAPGNLHMRVLREGFEVRIVLDEGPLENSCRPAIDVLFRSVASVYGDGALALVLTGMGSDGTLGSKAVKSAGGAVFVQDDASSVIASMPSSVAREVEVDGVLPLEEIASEITYRIRPRPQSGLLRIDLGRPPFAANE